MGKSTFPLDRDDRTDLQEHGLWWGIVAQNKDPAGRGRIRIKIPGLNDVESTWAEAVGNPGQGGDTHGMMAIPKIGSTVLVGFIQGDFNEPVYFGGPPPEGKVIEGADKPDNIVLASDNFRIIMQEEKETSTMRLRIETRLPDKTPAQRAAAQSYIEMSITAGDSKKVHAITVHAASALILESTGAININAPTVMIKGRGVSPSDREI